MSAQVQATLATSFSLHCPSRILASPEGRKLFQRSTLPIETSLFQPRPSRILCQPEGRKLFRMARRSLKHRFIELDKVVLGTEKSRK
jgi:hypothetical protein